MYALEGDAVGGEGVGLGELVAVGVVEAADARSEDLGGDEGGASAGHVDDAGAGEVVHAHAKGGFIVEGGEEAGGAPDGVHDDGVHEAREHDAVAQVGLELQKAGAGAREARVEID